MRSELAAGLSPRDTAVLARWVAECIARPGSLPVGVELVRGRLIRVVGRGELPDLGTAYVKVMAFPRVRDRVRYMIRPIPSVHEARMLDMIRTRAPEVATPRVLACVARRRFRVPWLSVLVTEGLPLVAGDLEPDVDRVAALAVHLASIGVFHPDLHPANTPLLRDGRLALLDLQSVRARAAPLSRGLRLRMAEKLAAPASAATLAAVVSSGLVGADDAERLMDRARRRERAEVDRRIRRCLTTSTEFRVRRSLRTTRFERRELESGLAVRRGGAELRAAWIGDRATQILDGAPPLFAALVHELLWPVGRYRLYIPRSTDPGIVDRRWPELLEGHQRWRRLCQGRESKQVEDG